MPNIMTLAQAVLQILCSQSPLKVQCLSPKKEIIQSNFDRILWKVNRVIYISVSKLYACFHDLAQAVLQIFCSQSCFSTQNDKVGKGR